MTDETANLLKRIEELHRRLMHLEEENRRLALDLYRATSRMVPQKVEP